VLVLKSKMCVAEVRRLVQGVVCFWAQQEDVEIGDLVECKSAGEENSQGHSLLVVVVPLRNILHAHFRGNITLVTAGPT
jgi:hypothetical protein